MRPGPPNEKVHPDCRGFLPRGFNAGLQGVSLGPVFRGPIEPPGKPFGGIDQGGRRKVRIGRHEIDRRVEPERGRKQLGAALAFVAGADQALFRRRGQGLRPFGVQRAADSLGFAGLGESRERLGFRHELLLDPYRRVGLHERQILH